MAYHPLMVQLQHKTVIVIGGGRIAERKVLSLLLSGAILTIVSPSLTKRLTELAEKQKIYWVQKHYERKDCVDALFIIAATNDTEMNEMIVKECHENQLTLNVSNHRTSNTIMPVRINYDNLQIAISTHGASPIIAKKIRNHIKEQIDIQHINLQLNDIGRKRNDIIHSVHDDAERKAQLLTLSNSVSF